MKNKGKVISFDEMISKEYIPLCQRRSGDWPCPEICGEMCKYWCTDECKDKEQK